MGAIGRGSAKLLLFGEHAAVYGHPAIGVSLPMTLTARLEGTPGPDWNLRGIPPGDREQVGAILSRLEARLPGLAAAGRCTVRIQSDVPRGVGLGSSAALCVALSLAALGHAGDRRELPAAAWELSHDAERLFHGTPSGVDTGLSLLGGLAAFRPRPPGLPESERLPGARVWLVAGAVPRDAACGALIAGLGERMRAGDSVVRGAISALGRIAGEARDALAGAAPDAAPHAAAVIGRLATQAMTELRSIGLSTASLDALLAAGMAAGALGGKLSGAGGGGAFYLVAQSRESAGSVAAAVRGISEQSGFPLVCPVRLVSLFP